MFWASGDKAYLVFPRETGLPSDVPVGGVLSLTGLSSGLEEAPVCDNSSKLRFPCCSCVKRSLTED